MGHRLVLCACSSVFREIILKSSTPNPSILLFDVELQELYNLLDFMYKGEVSVSQDRLQKFLDLAEKLEVKGLYQQGQSKTDSEKTKINHNPPAHNRDKEVSKTTTNDVEKVKEPAMIAMEDDNDVNLVAEDVVTLVTPDYAMDNIISYEYDNYDITSEDQHGYTIPHHNNFRDESINSYGDYPCILCGKTYKTAGSLKNHRSLYHRDEITKNKISNYSII